MRKIINKIYRIFVEWFSIKYKPLHCDNLPVTFQASVVYLIGEKNDPWQAAFICPCGCRSLIQLSLLSDSSQKWKVFLNNKNKISLSPSIHRKIGCKSHFYLHKGKIQWVRAKY